MADVLNASEFVLEGSPELIQQIVGAHDRHFDEIKGFVIGPPSRTGGVGTRKTWPVKVAVGGRRETGDVATAPGPVVIRVSSLRHIEERCAGRG